MAVTVMSTMGLYEALGAEGYQLPKNCRDVELSFDVDSAMMLTFKCFVEADDLTMIAKALLRMAKKEGELPK